MRFTDKKWRRFRFINRCYAFIHAYFWLPCPICGRTFGGHECSATDLMTSLNSGVGVCWECGDEAEKRSEGFIQLLRETPHEVR